MKKLVFILITVLCFSVFTFGQAEKTICPNIYINGPNGASRDFTMDFSAEINGLSKDIDYKFVWSAVGGEIIAGQGTPKIKSKLQKVITVLLRQQLKLKIYQRIVKVRHLKLLLFPDVVFLR